VVTYFIFLVDYGFDISGVMKLSDRQGDKKHISAVFHNVMAAKALLGLAGFVVISVMILAVGKFRNEWLLILLTFGMISGQVMIPSWFFRGMERMQYIAYSLVAVKSLYLVLIFVFVHSQSDYRLVPLANLIAYNLVGFLALKTVYSRFGVSFRMPEISDILSDIKEGFVYFTKAITDNFARITNTVVLGFAAGDAAVGYYGSAEKLMDAVRAMLNVFYQALFPHSSRTYKADRAAWLRFVKVAAIGGAALGLCMSSALFIFAPEAVNLILGSQYAESVQLLRIISFFIFFFSMNYVMSVLVIVCSGRAKAFLNLTFAARGLSVVLIAVLVPAYGQVGSAIVSVTSELIYTIILAAYIIKARGEI
jgi:PST family polysaccharide transporter